MKIVYCTRTGNVEAFVEKLGYDNVLKIKNGSEEVNEDFVLITYTDGYGELPVEIEDFLSSNADHLVGVAASGDLGYGEVFCAAADVISEMYGVKVLGKFEADGTEEDVENFKKELANL